MVDTRAEEGQKKFFFSFPLNGFFIRFEKRRKANLFLTLISLVIDFFIKESWEEPKK